MYLFGQSAETVEYTNSISAEGLDPTKECPDYDTHHISLFLCKNTKEAPCGKVANVPDLLLYTYDLRNSMNERTHFFIKICISHTLFSKKLMFLWYVRDEWRQGQTAILTQPLLLTIVRYVIFKNPLSTSSESWLGLFNRGRWGQQPSGSVLSLQAGSHSDLPVSNWLNGRWHLPVFFHNVHLLPLLLPLIWRRLGQRSIYKIVTL